MVVAMMSAASAAESVQWTLSSTVSTASGGSTLSLGTLFFPADDVMTKMGTATLPSGSEPGGYTNNASGIRVASIGKGSYSLSDVIATATAGALVAQDEVFTLKLSLTDGASNETGEASFIGKPILNIGTSSGGMGELILGIEGKSSATLNLGGMKYEIELSKDESESGSYIVADVTCVHEAPEPTTLLLGGIGLTGVVGMRLRKRRR